MLEAQALQRVGKLDVDAQVVGIELELVAGHDAAILVDVERQRRDRAVHREPPMDVAIRVRIEGHHQVASLAGGPTWGRGQWSAFMVPANVV